MAKNIVIMNKQHSLTEEQERLLKERFKEFKIMFVDEKGWTLNYMRNLTLNKDDNFIFVSPVPYLLARLCKEQYKVFLFHNDKRDKIDNNLTWLLAANDKSILWYVQW